MKRARTVLAAMTAMLAFAATQQASAAPDVSVATPAHAVRTMQLTNADNGRTVTGRLGDSVRVRLTPVVEDGLKWVFVKPASSDSSLAAQTGGTETPDGGASGSFDLVAAGKVVVQAGRRCVATTPGRVCPEVVLPWKVTLNVA
ncbi:hypothetical protein ABT084_08630 [Streptomyces sp. NPDC002138]|uniref:hypothetical protein n=1 Tax=Streptomyces sp. NPDC002138 TaxID=3154410 RepID=UPI00332C5880